MLSFTQSLMELNKKIRNKNKINNNVTFFFITSQNVGTSHWNNGSLQGSVLVLSSSHLVLCWSLVPHFFTRLPVKFPTCPPVFHRPNMFHLCLVISSFVKAVSPCLWLLARLYMWVFPFSFFSPVTEWPDFEISVDKQTLALSEPCPCTRVSKPLSD